MGPFKGTVVYNYISSIHHSGFPWEHEATVTTTSEMWNFKGDIFYSKVLTTKKSNICYLFVPRRWMDSQLDFYLGIKIKTRTITEATCPEAGTPTSLCANDAGWY